MSSSSSSLPSNPSSSAATAVVTLSNRSAVAEAKLWGFGQALYGGKFCDLRLACQEGKAVSAHAAVILPRATALAKTVEKDAADWRSSLLSFASPSSVEVLVEFFYTGEAVFFGREGEEGYKELLYLLAVVGFEEWDQLDLERLPPFVRDLPTKRAPSEHRWEE